MVDPLYRALVLAAIGLAGCEDSHEARDAVPSEEDVSQEDAPEPDVPGDAGEEDAPCPPDAELDMPPCYLIL